MLPEVVTERWALAVVREVSLGRRRFDELHAATGAPRAVLADRLRRLAEIGVLGTRGYRVPGRRTRQEYVLTDAGIDLLPLHAALAQWAQQHLGEPRYAFDRGDGRDEGRDDGHGSVDADRAAGRLDYRHLACGGQVSAVLVCECGQQVSPRDRLVAQIN